MIKLNVRQNQITVSNLEPLVVGNINSKFVSFIFSAEWELLSRIAVFRNGDAKVSLLLTSDICAIPWEVLVNSGSLFVSLRGIGNDGNFVICTENVFLGKVSESDASGSLTEATDATPEVLDALISDIEELKSSSGSGSTGENGKSAYEIAVDNGFEGSEIQWLASLKGEVGANGLDGGDGYTPIKGTDYFTDSDKQEIVNDVLAALPVWNGGVF